METNILFLLQNLFDYSVLITIQLILILLLRKSVRHYFGSRLSYLLWLLPLIWLPFYLIDWNAISLYWTTTTGSVTGSFLSAEQADNGIYNSLVVLSNFIQMDLNLPDYVLATEKVWLQNFWLALVPVWMTGTLFFSMKYIAQIRKFSQHIRLFGENFNQDALKLKDIYSLFGSRKVQVYKINGINTPSLFGIIRPALLLPHNFFRDYDENRRKLILTHEAMHFARKDNLWNFLAAMLNIIFWFNPFVYLAHHYYRLDQELSCDALTLGKCNDTQVKIYAQAILDSMQTITFPHKPALTGWGSFQDIKERVTMLSFQRDKKDKPFSSALLLLIMLLSGGFLSACYSTNESGSSQATQSTTSSQLLSRPVYELLKEITEHRSAGNDDLAMMRLGELRAMYDAGQLSKVETLRMWQFYANFAAQEDNFEGAIEYQELILAMDDAITPDVRANTLMLLGQLKFSVKDYPGAIENYLEYQESVDDPDIRVYLRIGIAYYSNQQAAASLPYFLEYMELANSQNINIEENIYQLLRSAYMLTNDLESARDLTEEMLQHFNDSELAGSGSDNLEFLKNVENSIAIRNASLDFPEENMRALQVLISVSPVYPQSALADEIEGWAMVMMTVNELGEVENPVIIASEPVGIFEESALEAIQKFRFEPRTSNGQAAALDGMRYLFRFSIDE